MGLYTFALLLNLILDMVLTSYLSYRQMVGVGVHTADGRLLADLTSLQQIFESYPMQKSLGNLLFAYCWPATFFLPFLFEPLAMWWLPLHMGVLFVRSDKKMKGKLAEQALTRGVMEQTRYGDVLFNIVLVCFIPFIAPAYVALTFAALVFSHVFIYAYDHFRTLRGVGRYWFSGISVSRYAQKLFAIPNGLLLSALIFKLNQRSADEKTLGSGVLQGYKLGAALAWSFLLHCLVHVLFLDQVIPRLALSASEAHDPSEPYEDTARSTACTWFSANPVHCLRSQYVYNHDPPQRYFIIGKEELQQKNPKIGAFYDPAEQAAERARLAAEGEAQAAAQEAPAEAGEKQAEGKPPDA